MIETRRRQLGGTVTGRIPVILGCCLALSLLSSQLISSVGYFVPGQHVVASITVLFVPGCLLLWALGVGCRHRLKFLVYAAGVSLAFTLGIGISATSILVGMGVSRPFDAMPWVFGGSLIVLSALAYWGESEHEWEHHVAITPRSVLSILFLALLPVLAVVTSGTNGDSTTDASLVLLGLLAVVVVLLGIRAIPTGIHAFAVWSVSIAVLLQMTLVSNHIWGWDIHYQYSMARRIIEHGVWAPGVGIEEQSLLAVTLGAALIASITGVELVWVYKLLYPVLVSVLPVALYYLARSQFDDEYIAVLAPFCLVFYYGYFKIFPGKQIIAQLFLGLVLLVTFDTRIAGIRKRALAMVFGAMMIVSHYGISLLFVGFLAATIVFVAATRLVTGDRSIGSESPRPTFVSFVGVGWVFWYLFSATGVNFERVVLTGYESLTTVSGDGSSRTALAYLAEAFGSPLWTGYKLVIIGLIGFIGIGVIWTVSTTLIGRNDKTSLAFGGFAAVTLGFLVSSITITYGMGFDRTLLLSLTVLAPFALIGFRALVWWLPAGLIGIDPPGPRATASLFGVFLAILFLFSSGAVFAVAGQPVPAYSIHLDDDAGWPVYSQSEVKASRWLDGSVPSGSRVAVYNDWEHLKSRDALLVREVMDPDRIEPIWLSRTNVSNASFVYVSERSMAYSSGNNRTYIDFRETPMYEQQLVTANRVYVGDEMRIFRLRHSEQPSDRRANVEANATDAD